MVDLRRRSRWHQGLSSSGAPIGMVRREKLLFALGTLPLAFSLARGSSESSTLTNTNSQTKPQYEKLDRDLESGSPPAIQSASDVGPNYAGGMVYHQPTDSIYITGATYGSFFEEDASQTPKSKSACFFGALSWPQLTFDESSTNTHGSSNNPVACNSLAMHTASSDSRLTSSIVVGSSEGGTFLSQRMRSQQSAFALNLVSNDGKAFEMEDGVVMEHDGVQFPIAVATDSSGQNSWVVSMFSKDSKLHPDLEKTSTEEFPNLTTGGVEKYGSTYRIVLQKLEAMVNGESGQQDLEPKWSRNFADDDSVYVSDILFVDGGKKLVIVGSSATGVGGKDGMDGFIAKVEPESGLLDRPNDSESRDNFKTITHLSSVDDKDDFILNGCVDSSDPTSFFVVGATEGSLEASATRHPEDVTVHAYVSRIDLATLSPLWTQQFAVHHAEGTSKKQAAAAALGCDVIQGDGSMYVAGVVENGAYLQYNGQASAGRDDIFVSKLKTQDGSIEWVRQIGSNGDDRIAHGGGIKADANGNAIVFGDTNGSLFRERVNDQDTEHYSDIFVMTLNKADGGHATPIQAAPIASLPHDTSTPNEWYPSSFEGFEFDTSKSTNPTLKILFRLVLTLGLLIVLYRLFQVTKDREEARRERVRQSSMYQYLQHFEVEEIDFRKSPPGGWHGTYLKPLRQKMDMEDSSSRLFETTGIKSSSCHASFIMDNLFVDNDIKKPEEFHDDIYMDSDIDILVGGDSDEESETVGIV